MIFKLLIKDQLCIFLDSLKAQIEAKHSVVTEDLPDHVDFELGENMKSEVIKMKLDIAPSFRPNEIGLQCKFVQSEKVISLWAFCYKDFKQLDINDSDAAEWGRAVIKLASFSKASDRLSRGLESRSIRIGLAREYIRMIGDSNMLMAFVCAGNGFQSAHWHSDEDIQDIVQYRLKAQKLIKLASEQKSEDKIYCGNPDAPVEYLARDGTWVKTNNSSVISEKVGTTLKIGVEKSEDKRPTNDERADSLAGSRDVDGAVGFERVSPRGACANFARPDHSGLNSSFVNQSQDVRNTLRPRVNQPGRPLPPTPKYEDMGQRNGYPGERWPSDMLHAGVDDQGYHYAIHNEGGARKKRSFSSMSTVRLEEKLADRMQLLNDVRDQSLNVSGANGASSLHSPGRGGSGFENFSGSMAPAIDELSMAFSNTCLGTPDNTPNALRDWDHSSPLDPMHRTAGNNVVRGFDVHRLSPNQAKHQEQLRQIIQSNMSRINRFHLEVNELKAKRGLDVSVGDIDVELYKSQNLIASTDPSMLSNNYAERIRILEDINRNLESNLVKKKELLTMLAQPDNRPTASNSEPRRRSERLKNQAKKSLSKSFLWY